jgi:flagellar hook-length control protein FliK
LPPGRKEAAETPAKAGGSFYNQLNYMDISACTGVARSLLNKRWIHLERPPVFSVTADTTSGVSFPDPRSRPSRDDQRSMADSFAALVDSSTASDNSRQAPPLPDPPAPQQSSDAASAANGPNSAPSAANDSRPARDDNQSDTPSAADASNRNNDPRNSDAGASTGASSKPSKSGDGKHDKKDSAAQADNASDPKTGSDSTASPQPAPAVPVTAVAVTIPVPILTPANAATAPAATDNGGATAPLAIAAAALKAQQAAASEAAQTAAGQPSPQTDQALAAAMAAAKPSAGKAALTTPTGVSPTDGTAKTATGAKSGTADPAAAAAAAASQTANGTAAAQQNAVAKADAKHDDATADSIKADAPGTGTPAPPVAAPSHDNAAAIAAQAVPVDTGQQAANAVQQPPLQPAVTTALTAAQLTATAVSHAAVPLSGLAVEIAANVAGGKSRFEIRLDPAELGRIDVRMDVDAKGQVTSHVTVERPETLAMLRQDAPQLQRALDNAGLKTGDGGLQFSLRDQSSSGQNGGNGQGRNAQRLIVSDNDTVPVVTAQRSYGRTLGSNSGVDIRI